MSDRDANLEVSAVDALHTTDESETTRRVVTMRHETEAVAVHVSTRR